MLPVAGWNETKFLFYLRRQHVPEIQEAKLSLGYPTVLPKIVESRYLGHDHFQGKLFVRLLGIAHSKPRIKFEVSSSSSFRDIALWA